MSETNEYPALTYTWQKAMLDVFREFEPESLPAKIYAAERAIADRLRNGIPPDEFELTAIEDAHRALHLLFPKRVERSRESFKKDVA
jgi:hypothetical protein